MTRDEFEQRAIRLLTEAVEEGGIDHFILLYTSEGKKSTYTISDAPDPALIAEALGYWIETYKKKGTTGDTRVFADGVEIKGDGESH